MKGALYGELSVIGMSGCEQFVAQVDNYLKEWRRHGGEESFLARAECPRFSTGEAKGMLHQSLRGHDVYLICDPFNYSVTYNMYGKQVRSQVRLAVYRSLCPCSTRAVSTSALTASLLTAR